MEGVGGNGRDQRHTWPWGRCGGGEVVALTTAEGVARRPRDAGTRLWRNANTEREVRVELCSQAFSAQRLSL